MQIRIKMEALIREMVDGRIMLSEAVTEFEKLYIKEALSRNDGHISKTASALGVHRNTLSKRVAGRPSRAKSPKKPIRRKRG